MRTSGALVAGAVVALALAVSAAAHASPVMPAQLGDAPEPYPPLNGGAFSGKAQPLSPDPLVAYVWGAGVNASQLQVFTQKPVKVTSNCPASFRGIESLLTDDINVTVLGSGTITLDFGSEFPAWIEVDSEDLNNTSVGGPMALRMAVSEYNEPWCCPSKTQVPKQYGQTFRLETNPQLYEGVRFGFLRVGSGLCPAPDGDDSRQRDDEADTTSLVGSSGDVGGCDLAGTWWGQPQYAAIHVSVSEDATGQFAASAGVYWDSAAGQDFGNGTVSLRIAGSQIGYVGAVQAFNASSPPCTAIVWNDGHSAWCRPPSCQPPAAASAPWHITGFRLVSQTKPANYLGGFHSPDDQLLERIFWVGAWNVRTNMLSDQFGAILMYRGDRYAWVGDDHVAQAAAMAAFGDFAFVKENLFFTEGNCNNILSYCVYWTMSAADYLNATADVDTYKALVPNITAALDTAVANSQPGQRPNLRFFGWDDRLGSGFRNPTADEPERDYRMLVVRACKEAAYALGVVNETAAAAKYAAAAEQLVAQLRSNPEWPATFGMHSAAAAINAGFTTAAETQQLAQLFFDDEIQICSYSPFNGYWIIQALTRLGFSEKLIATLKRCWGGQIQMGGTTFWEVFDPDWVSVSNAGAVDPVPWGDNGPTSMCHPWSSGPTAWMPRALLGVEPLLPGFVEFTVRPMLGASLPRVSGKVPTPHGEVEVDFDLLAARAAVGVPRGTRARVSLRRSGVRAATGRDVGRVVAVRSNTVLWDGSDSSTRSTSSLVDEIALPPLAPGSHELRLEFVERSANAGDEPASLVDAPFPPMAYKAEYVGRDDTTSGSWVDAGLGTDGYYFFAFNDDGSDLSRLPSYVTAVNITFHGDTGKFSGVFPPDSDARALQSPAGGATGRGIGWFGGRTWSVVDIEVDEVELARVRKAELGNAITAAASDAAAASKPSFRVGLYVCDYDRQGLSTSVAAEALGTFDKVAPTQRVGSTESGAWISYRYTGGLRFNSRHVPPHPYLGSGDVIHLSGLVFDP